MLLRETGWGPVRSWLNRIHDRLATRVAAEDPDHPFRHRWKTTLLIWIRRRQEVELSHTITDPPWLTIERDTNLREIGATGRHDGLNSFETWNKSQRPLDLTVYSDGSVDTTEKSGAGYCVYRGFQEILHDLLLLGHTAEVYDAEIIAAVEGLRAACSHFMTRFATNLTICLDNQEAAFRLHTCSPTPSSSSQFHTFQKLKIMWLSRFRAIGTQIGSVNIRWIPGHKGIKGNIRADALAKEACALGTFRTTMTISQARRALVDRYKEVVTNY